ncbi:MAG TPA: carboxypeptidase regulatory-like domain-containing protein [Gemmataceae bacterium]|nr:carboxypeptidase regulatory-like domain-containing protein [Gemmataceae bacterium]
MKQFSRFFGNRKRITTEAAKARRSKPRFIPHLETLEIRLTPGSADPANVTAIYDASAQSLSVSFQQAIGSKDTPVYGAAFLDPAYPTTAGGITENAVTTSGSNVLTFTGGNSTFGLLAGQTVTGNGISAGTTIVSVDSATQVTLSSPATATSLSTGTKLTFTMVLSGTLTNGSNVVTGLSSTSGLFVGQSVIGTGIPIPKLPTNPTTGTSEITTRIASIGADGHSVTLTANATASGTVNLTFVTGLALDGSGQEFVDNVIDNIEVYTFTYTYSATYQNPYLLTAPPDVCMTLYHNTGVASGFHSVVGDGPGLNTDNSLNNNKNSGEYQVYSGLIDYNLSGKIDAGDNTPITTMNGTLTNGSATVTGLSSTGNLFVGEYVTGSGLPAGTQVASIIDSNTITLSNAATASGGKPLTFDTVTVAGYRIINGAVDLNHDGAISGADTTSTLAGHPQIAGFNVIGGKIDLNGNGKIDANDTGGLGVDAICTTPTVINAFASLSGFVTNPTAGTGIGGVSITLTEYDSNGNVLATFTTTTAADGSYSFGGLSAGTYSLSEDTTTLPVPDVALGSSAGTVGGNTDGTSSSVSLLSNINLAAGNAGINYDFTAGPIIG